MKVISKLPKANGIIGVREIIKGIEAGKIKNVVIAKNCPEFLKEKIPSNVKIEIFNGDQKQLGTALGKPFPVAMVGYK